MIMNAVVPQKLPSKASAERFHRLRNHVMQPSTAEKLWEVVFTEDERERLTPKLPELDLLQKQAINAGKTPKGQAIWMWNQLYGVSYQQAVIEISAAFNWISPTEVDWLLREGGELPRNPEDLRDILITRGDLVILRCSRDVFWQGERIDADWYQFRESWEFLLIASECAKRGEAIDSFSFGQPNLGGVVAHKKSRLKTQVPSFPKSLYDAFKSAGTGTQKLTIPADQIHFFDE
ncbi:MAG: hypothetical protein JSS49_21975 [Planctomycetes bacterium]|nr:hypothetical protein [Planctomycetota bacterium]